MPTTNQKAGSSDGDYDTEAERFVATKPKQVVLSVKPMTEANAREWLGACNKLDADQEVVEHFAAEVRRLK